MPTFKKKVHKKQYKDKMLEAHVALSYQHWRRQSPPFIKSIDKCQKQIRIAARSKYEWATVEEYHERINLCGEQNRAIHVVPCPMNN